MEVRWEPGCEKEVAKIITDLNDMLERNKEWFQMREHFRTMEPKKLPEVEWKWADGFNIQVRDRRLAMDLVRSPFPRTFEGIDYECDIPGVKVEAMFHDTIDNIIYVVLVEDSLMPRLTGLRPIPVGTRPPEWVFL